MKENKAARKAIAQRRVQQRQVGGMILLTFLVLGSVGVMIWLQIRQQAVALAYPPGPANWCKTTPAFVAELGLSTKSVLSTTDTLKGVVAIDQIDTEQPTRYQHPSWDDFGYLGAIVRDKAGDVYLYPVPRVSLVDNPPAQQNTLYRLDGRTQELQPFLALTGAAQPNETNPFGILGLTYDCENNSLYTSSVAGSTRTQELGQIMQVNIATKEVRSILKNHDAMGVSVYNTATSKRLFFGSARTPVIYSVALDKNGNFSGEPQPEIQLAELGVRVDARARRIEFIDTDQMLLYVLPFSFNLVAQSERQEEVLLLKRVDDKWVLSERR
jgi:hypothetical protein